MRQTILDTRIAPYLKQGFTVVQIIGGQPSFNPRSNTGSIIKQINLSKNDVVIVPGAKRQYASMGYINAVLIKPALHNANHYIDWRWC